MIFFLGGEGAACVPNPHLQDKQHVNSFNIRDFFFFKCHHLQVTWDMSQNFLKEIEWSRHLSCPESRIEVLHVVIIIITTTIIIVVVVSIIINPLPFGCCSNTTVLEDGA